MTRNYSTASNLFQFRVLATGVDHRVKIHTQAVTADGTAWNGYDPPGPSTPILEAIALLNVCKPLYSSDFTLSEVESYKPRTSTHGQLYVAGESPGTNGTHSTYQVQNASELTWTFRCPSGKTAKFVLLDTGHNGLPVKVVSVTALPAVYAAVSNVILTGGYLSFWGEALTTLLSFSATYNKKLIERYRL